VSSYARADEPIDRPMWDASVQTMPRDQLRALQNERLRAVILRAFDRPVPFFKAKLEAAGVESPADIRTVEDLDRIPLTTKAELRESEAAHPPVGDYRFFDLREAVRLGLSGGTTGTPTINLWTALDVEVEHETGARRLWREGFRPGQIVTHGHPAYLYSGGLMVQSTYEYMGVLSLWVPPPETDELAEQGIRMWQRIRPDRPFHGQAQRRFTEVAIKLGLDPREDLNLTNAGLGGRPVQNVEVGVYPLNTAGSEAFSYLGGPCEHSTGAHITEDFAYVQALDPATGKEVPDGEWGTHVITTFGKDGALIRYDLEELCRFDTSMCSCGETSKRGWWGGRVQDLLNTQGKRIWSFDVDTVLSKVPEITVPSLEFVAVRPQEESAPLRLRVEYDGAERPAVEEQIAAQMREHFAVAVAVEFVGRGSLPRYAHKRSLIAES
jgi:phenylacetate-CoA ligase